MKILTVALCLLASPAFAGGVTFGTQSASPSVNASKTFTVPDADMARLYAFVQATFPLNDDGSNATRAQSLAMWTAFMMQRVKADIGDFERAQANKSLPAAISAQ